jgi:hypothetical protein
VGVATAPLSYVLAKGGLKVSDSLKKLGQSRLFRGAVGQSKKAAETFENKDLMPDAEQYLDDLGVGGHSPAEIAKKLAVRKETVGSVLDDVVSQLDQASGGQVKFSPDELADAVEQKVAAPLKKFAASQEEYAQVMKEVQHLRNLEGEQSFADLAAQRGKYQKKVNYNPAQLSLSGETKNAIANALNDLADAKAAPLLEKAGEAGDAYRELRHEFRLAAMLEDFASGHAGTDKARSFLNVPNMTTAGAVGATTQDPVKAAAAAVAAALVKKYGNQVAGRNLVHLASMASAGSELTDTAIPAAVRAAGVPEELWQIFSKKEELPSELDPELEPIPSPREPSIEDLFSGKPSSKELTKQGPKPSSPEAMQKPRQRLK